MIAESGLPLARMRPSRCSTSAGRHGASANPAGDRVEKELELSRLRAESLSKIPEAQFMRWSRLSLFWHYRLEFAGSGLS